MIIHINQLRDADIIEERDEVTIVLNEMDGNYYGSKTDIKIPAKSYEMLEEAIVERWLEKVKESI
ncbi:MAG: hypothetical protein M0R74_09790 [Dehalococcoidia bacterium]|nr:hypothetical protein [Dehalococcoidia bacterium]